MKYKIGSFNMKNFSASSDKDFEKIADIITEEDMDVVALQEILSEGQGVKRLLEQDIKNSLYQWDFCWDFPSEPSDQGKEADMILGDRRGEGYAFLWNKKKFKLAEVMKLGENRVFEPRIINSKSNDVYANCSFFARTPYYIRLQPCFGGFFELRLINAHLYFGSNTLPDVAKRNAEFEFLTQQMYKDISNRRYGNFRHAYTIAMGDYNLNIYNPLVQTQASANCNLEQVYSYTEGHKTVHILTDQDQLTTLRNVDPDDPDTTEKDWYANNYDHFTYQEEQFDKNRPTCTPIDAIKKYCHGDLSYYQDKISDHLPIVMEVEL